MEEIVSNSLSILKKYEVKEYRDICNTIMSFSKYNEFEFARELLKKLIKFQIKEGFFEIESKIYSPVLFLESLSCYFNSLYEFETIKTEKSNLSENQNFKKTLKSEIDFFSNNFKRVIEYLRNNISSDYILLYNTLNKFEGKVYYALENAVILSFADELSQILNQFNYNKEADFIFMFKTKIELGFNRYFYHNSTKKLIYSFKENFQIIFPNVTQYYKILNKYISNKNLLSSYEIETKNNLDFLEQKLLYINLIKANKKQFDLELKKLKSLIMKFPKFIWDKDYFETYFELSKSINKDFNITSEELKSKQVLVDLNSVQTINLVLNIYSK